MVAKRNIALVPSKVSEEVLRTVGLAFGPEGINRVEVHGSGTQRDGLIKMEGRFSTGQHGQRLGFESEEKTSDHGTRTVVTTFR